ncbi:uncharacterized protein LOC102085062 [Columba livia]|uniref:uncharacterized protein LOC102085062 n=1 Tax=Columba livia TaxID=8932 RepID=UPI0031BA6954
MFSALSQYEGNSCGQKTTSGPGWKSFLPVQIMPCVEDSTTYKERGFPSHLPVGQGEKNRFCDTDGNVDEPLGPQCGWVSRHPELPGQTDKGTGRGRVGERCVPRGVWVLVLVLLLVLLLAAVLSAGRAGARAAAVLGCPDDWVGYRNVCYYLSSTEQEGSWEWSQERCSLLGASLAVLEREWETEFLSRLRGNIDYWLGLRRRDGRLQWVNGSSFNHRYLVYDQGECAFLNSRGVVISSCSQLRPYLCSKPQAIISLVFLRTGACVPPPQKLLPQEPQQQLEAAVGVGDKPTCCSSWKLETEAALDQGGGPEKPIFRSACTGCRSREQSQGPVSTSPAMGTLGGFSLKCIKDQKVPIGVTVVVAALLLTIIALAVKKCPSCPSHVLPSCLNNGIGYGEKCFYFIEDEAEWNRSRIVCVSLGAHLATIDSWEELRFLLRYGRSLHYWLGLQREESGPWKWVNGSLFNNWFDVRGKGQCAYINQDGVSSDWCSQTKFSVCSHQQNRPSAIQKDS